MSFFETPVRRLRVVRACGLFALAIGIGCLPLLTKLDEMGRAIWIAMVGGCIAAGLANLWLARRTPPNETVIHYAFVTAPAEQVHHFRHLLWTSAIAFPLLYFVTVYEFHRLNSGVMVRVQIWWPVAFIYEHFGYWPTVIFLPVLGVCCCAVFVKKLRKLSAPRAVSTLDNKRRHN